MPEITITKVEYLELLRASERVEAVERLVQSQKYTTTAEILAVLDIEKEADNGEL